MPSQKNLIEKLAEDAAELAKWKCDRHYRLSADEAVVKVVRAHHIARTNPEAYCAQVLPHAVNIIEAQRRARVKRPSARRPVRT